MSIPLNVATVLEKHVTLELECLGRMGLSGYVPGLKREGGVAYVFRTQGGQPFAASALMGPISRAFVQAIGGFVQGARVPLRRHPAYQKPGLLATRPNQVWDITKLLGPAKWTYFYLYVLLDIFSRYVVGWVLARGESAALAKLLIEQSCQRQHVAADQLIIHADRGPSMTSKPVALLLATLGVLPSHSRPHVSDDNPFSEAQFKTLKYRPDFPARFGSFEDAEAFCRRFFPWYNTEHCHISLGLMVPSDLHYGLAPAKWRPGRGPAGRLPGSPRAVPSRHAGPGSSADRRLDQQTSRTSDLARRAARHLAGGSRHPRPGGLMRAAHKFPAPTVSLDLTSNRAR
jgi:transposase InsO family protein